MNGAVALMQPVANKQPKQPMLPEITGVQKLVVWKTADGVYHEKVDDCRQALLTHALGEFAKINGITDVSVLAKEVALNIDRINHSIEASLKKISS